MSEKQRPEEDMVASETITKKPRKRKAVAAAEAGDSPAPKRTRKRKTVDQVEPAADTTPVSNKKAIPIKLVMGAISAVANEKGVLENEIFAAMEAALVAATKRKHGADSEFRIVIDQVTGEYDTFRRWQVIPDAFEPGTILTEGILLLSEAREKKPDAEVGDWIEEQVPSIEFGRIEVQYARTVIMDLIRKAERQKIAEEFSQRKDRLLTGVIKKTSREAIFVDLGGNAEAILPREDLLPREAVRPGDRIRAYLKGVNKEARGPQLILSRSCNEMLMELFHLEVPEVGEGIIEIKGCARDPGVRAKIAVKTNDGRIDPVGACVGMRGARVQAVSNELGGERVDIVLWDDNPAQYVMNAMSPAEIVSIVVDEDSHQMEVAVAESHLSQAIGRNGQNVKLASALTGWTLNVISDSEAKIQTEQEHDRLRKVFSDQLQLDDEVANVLIEEGFTSVEEIAYVPVQELLQIDGFDEEIVTELRDRAKNCLLTQAIASEEQLGENEPSEDLLNLPGMDRHLAFVLASRGISTRDALADLALDDLIDIPDLDPKRAGELIIAARAHWFENE